MSATVKPALDLEPYLGTLRQLVAELGPQRPFQPTLKNLLRTLAEKQGFIRPYLTIYDPETRILKLSLTHGPVKNAKATYEPGQGIIGQVFNSGQPVIVPRIKDHPDFLNKAFGRDEEELANLAFICVPVLTPYSDLDEARDVIGTLSVDTSTADFELLEAQCRYLEVVAGLIANQASYIQEEMARQKHLMAQGLVTSGSQDFGFESYSIVATAKSMRLVLNQVAQVGPSRATVLLRGESGTGKELFAEAIHAASPRSEMPLVKLNCAALPSELVESELFGHQKGAFTGAVHTKKGLFELANKGTFVPRRNRRAEPQRPGQGVARDSGAGNPASGQRADLQCRRAVDLRHAPPFGRARGTGKFPGRFVLSDQCISHLHPQAVGTP